MSSPIRPPLTIETVDGATEGRPINTIKVTNGDLTVSGTTATIDTSGTSVTPGAPAKSIQFNSDPAGTFTGSSQLLYDTTLNAGRIEMSSGAVATQPEIRAMTGRGLQLSSSNTDGTIRNQIVVFGESDAPDGVALFPAAGLYVQVGDSGSTPAQITSRGAAADLVLTTNLTEDKAKITLEAGANGNILVQTDNTGVFQLENTTTNQNSILTVLGNGSGTPKAILKNASMEVDLTCEADGKLYIRDPTSGNRFILDASGAATGITFPDSTVQTTAASGGSPAGSNTQIQFNNSGAFGASSDLTWDGTSIVLAAGKTIQLPSAYQPNPTPLNFTGDLGTGICHNGSGSFSIFSQGTIVQTHSLEGIKINRGAARIYMDGSDKLNLQGSATGAIRCNDAYDLPTAVTGTNDYFLQAQTDGSTAWAAAGISTAAPASASATGKAGAIAYDSNYIYICTATDTWKRTAIATW
jgi:hypothetical protein